MGILIFIVFSIVAIGFTVDGANVIYAVNAGGGHHEDQNGIRFIADPLSVGVASDYGQRFTIRRSSLEDQILYQTERWHHDSFSYDIPVKSDGDYVLVLKFAEVYFNSAEQKIFDIQLNNQHQVVTNLDIFDKVGHATAHDEIIPFSVEKGKFKVAGETSNFNGVLSMELAKGAADNPKICAFYVIQGSVDDVSTLPPLDLLNKVEEDEEEDEDEVEISTQDDHNSDLKLSDSNEKQDRHIKSGPPAINPYAEDNSSLILPIVIAFSAFIPTLVCLCRL